MDDHSHSRAGKKTAPGVVTRSPNSVLNCDVAIIGAGFAGSLLAAVLGKKGLSPIVIDLHDVYPYDFRCEKFSEDQIAALRELDVLDGFRTPELFGSDAGNLTAKGLRYDHMVNALRAQWSENVRFVAGKVTALRRDRYSQTLKLGDGNEIEARLTILATGPGEKLRADLGLKRQVLSADHSLCIGFSLLPEGGKTFDFNGLVHHGEKPGDGIGYASLFRIKDVMRVNLFLYDAVKSERVRGFREDPVTALGQALPRLKARLGKATLSGDVEMRVTDLYDVEASALEGVVLIGDARRTSCPASGTGISRVISDVKHLANAYAPQWLTEAGSPPVFYSDDALRALDARSHQRSLNGRELATNTGLIWRLRRLAHKIRSAMQARVTSKTPDAVEHFYSGDAVRVRSAVEILSTLDMDGKLEGLPFMPEMVALIGAQARVQRRADRTCVEGFGLRGMKDAVFLEKARCDGSAHDGCQRDCLMFWKDAWLAPADTSVAPSPRAEEAARQRLLELATRNEGGGFVCQSTELNRATHSISKMHAGELLSEVRTGEMSPAGFANIVYRAIINKVRALFKLPEMGILTGEAGRKSKGDLDLQPGEWVRIRDSEAIRKSLSPKARNLGLSFEPEMSRLIGEVRQVDTIVERMVHEETGQMVRLERTVTLKDTYCLGLCTKACPRSNPLFWREVWLERVAAPK